MTEQAVLVLEIGNERAHFEAAFPRLEVVWLETSAGEDQVLLRDQEALLHCGLDPQSIAEHGSRIGPART